MTDAGHVARELAEAVTALRTRIGPPAAYGVVLGSGLGAFADTLDERVIIPFAEIPGMPTVGVAGHAGRLVAGRVGAARVRVLVLEGRLHLYEGHSPERVVYGVRLLAALGARTLLLTNAAGGLRADLRAGDLMLIEDHLNLSGHNALVGAEVPGGVRFVDMRRAYDPDLAAVALDVARAQGVRLACGVYAGVLGPNYETAAEVRMLRTLGADAVGMSTVLETIAARQLGVRVLGLSCITNATDDTPGASSALDHAEVARVAGASTPKLVALLTGILDALARTETP